MRRPCTTPTTMVFPPRANSWRTLSRLDTTPGFHHLAIMQAVESSLAELESKIQGMETTVRTHWTQPYRRSTRSKRHRQQTGSARQTTPGTWLGDVPRPGETWISGDAGESWAWLTGGLSRKDDLTARWGRLSCAIMHRETNNPWWAKRRKGRNWKKNPLPEDQWEARMECCHERVRRLEDTVRYHAGEHLS